MTAPDHPSPKQFFQVVVDLGPEERTAYLDEHCPDADVRAEVEALLGHHDDPTRDLSAIAFAPLPGPDEAETASTLASFERLDEFRVLRQIGHGGMATVFLAEDTILERVVALKVLPPIHTRSPTRVARFQHEARSVARLNHPGIVPIYRVGCERGLHYIAMEFVEGTTLAAELDDLRRLPLRERQRRVRSGDYLRTQAARLARVADAIEHAHKHGIIHRDVKPSNILLDADGQTRLTDFGIAKNLRDESLTVTGELAGTCYYMSPEQARARSTGIDLRTDVFSLGVVLYELVTVQLPFDGETTHDVLQQVIMKQPRPARAVNPACSKDLETIIHKAIEKAPRHRYQSAAHLAADLDCYLRGAPILARPPGPVRRVTRVVRKAWLALLLAVLLPIAATAGIAAYRWLTDVRPTLSVTVAAAEPGWATPTVWIRPIDPVTGIVGALRQLGVAPVDGVRVEPGYCRIIVDAGDAFAEMTRWLAEDETIVVVAMLRSTESATTGMISIPAGTTLLASTPESSLTEYQQRARAVEALWIDETEVSNAQYKRFVDQTGYRSPAWWGESYDADWDDLPVVGITFGDAQRYAEWAGKRLPTAVEWMLAAVGPSGVEYPWGAQAGDVRIKANAGRDAISGSAAIAKDDASLRAAYLDNVVPVRSREPERTFADSSPFLLLHTYGNVAEWTESIPTETSDGHVVPVHANRVAKGDFWGRPPDHEWGLIDGSMTLGPDRPTMGIGFRCAKSIAPAGQ